MAGSRGGTTELIAIGRIVKPFGVKGEVWVRSLSDVPGRFRDLAGGIEVTLEAPSGRSIKTGVTRVRPDRGSGDFYVLGFDALATPEEAARFRGGLIKIARAQAPPLPEGQYYEFQLVGLTVKDDTGRVLGELEEVLETGSNHVFVVRGEGREILIPGTKEVVVAVDLDEQTMTVRLLEGLVDEKDRG